MIKKKILIVGHGRHGKDTMAEILAENFDFTFMSSSMAAAKIFIFDKLKEKYNYQTFEECYEDRANHRDEWYDLITNYNLNDRTRLAKSILQDCDCYVGMRNPEELKESDAQHIFDIKIWVDASERLPSEPTSSMGITKDMCDIIITNNTTKEDFEKKVTTFGKLFCKPFFVSLEEFQLYKNALLNNYIPEPEVCKKTFKEYLQNVKTKYDEAANYISKLNIPKEHEFKLHSHSLSALGNKKPVNTWDTVAPKPNISTAGWWKKPFKKLFIDIDGIIADFEKAFSEKFDLPDSPHDWADHRYVSRLENLRTDKEFWLNIKTIINPALISYPIAGYCTARSIPFEWIQEWLNINLFPNAPILQVGFGESKVEKLKEAGCEVFIDDSIQNFVELNSNNILCYLSSRSHNMKYDVGDLRVSNLLELINRLKK